MSIVDFILITLSIYGWGLINVLRTEASEKRILKAIRKLEEGE